MLPQGASAPFAPDAAIREAQSDSATLAAAPFVAGPNDLLYVANAGNNSITVYRTDASDNTAPVATIKGSKTQLNGPGQLSEDANGDLYVANEVGMTPSSILVFKHGANGNVAPLRVIAGSLTGLSASYLEAVTVDQTSGKIFAMSDVKAGTSELIRFPANASGDAAPIATSQKGLTPANELASDSTGENIIEASGPVCCLAASAGVYTLKKQFSNGGDNSPVYSILAFENHGLADDPTTKTYLVSASDGIFRFDEDTVGSGATEAGPPKFSPPVVSVITSDTCGSQLALGYERNIYVAHSTANSCATDAVYVYEHDASGNATPLRVLTGPATNLDHPSGIYEGR